MNNRVIARGAAPVCLLLLAAAISPAAAQGPELGTPVPLIDVPETDGAETAGQACGACDYWIVSGRPCDGTIPHCNDYRLKYFRCDDRRAVPVADCEHFRNWFRPGVPVCIVVHGSFIGFDTVEQSSRRLYRWIRDAAPERPLQVVFYTWPSEGPITALITLDVMILGRRSAFHGIYLSQLIGDIPAESQVGLFGHSHGARTISSALHLLAGGSVQGFRLQQPERSRHRIRAVFTAAAVDHQWLNPGERYGRALCRVDHVLNFVNPLDVALALYPLRRPFGRRAAGQSGFTAGDRRRMGALACKIADVDVSNFVLHHHDWSYYYDRQALAEMMVPYLYGDTLTPASGSESASNRGKVQTLVTLGAPQ